MLNKAETSIKRASVINLVSRYSAVGIQLIYTVILARLLAPDQFGIVAIAQVFVVFFTLFSDMGIGAAVVQRQDLENDQVKGIFGFTVWLGLLLGVLFALCSYPIAWIYNNELLVPICIGMSFSVVFSTFNTVPNSLLRKSKRFILIGVRQIITGLIASAIGVISAVLGAGCFAIVAYSVSSSFIIFVWNWSTTRPIPKTRGMASAIRSVFSYSVYIFGFNFINYFSRNADNLLVGYFFGTTLLGNYSRAYQLTTMPQNYLTTTVTSVLHPMLAEHQNDVQHIYDTFLKTVKILSLAGIFITVFCFFAAQDVIFVIYGDQWTGAVICFQLLSISIWSQMVCGTSGAMFQVLNFTKYQFIRGLITASTTVGAICLGLYLGSIESVAGCVTVAYLLNFVTMLFFLVKGSFKHRIKSFLKELLPDLGVTACYVIVNVALFWLPIANVYASFFVKLAVAAAAYVLLLIVFRQTKWIAIVLPSRIAKKIPQRLLN